MTDTCSKSNPYLRYIVAGDSTRPETRKQDCILGDSRYQAQHQIVVHPRQFVRSENEDCNFEKPIGGNNYCYEMNNSVNNLFTLIICGLYSTEIQGFRY